MFLGVSLRIFLFLACSDESPKFLANLISNSAQFDGSLLSDPLGVSCYHFQVAGEFV